MLQESPQPAGVGHVFRCLQPLRTCFHRIIAHCPHVQFPIFNIPGRVTFENNFYNHFVCVFMVNMLWLISWLLLFCLARLVNASLKNLYTCGTYFPCCSPNLGRQCFYILLTLYCGCCIHITRWICICILMFFMVLMYQVMSHLFLLHN